MAPNPQNNVIKGAEDLELRKPITQLTGDEVVISGISGLFPCSDNVEEFMKNLFNGVDMVTNEGTFKHPQFPTHLGKVNGYNKFDAQFFGVPNAQVESLDPMIRKVLENAYESLFDAGVNPKTIAGSKLGVFSGVSFTDIVSPSFYNVARSNSNYIMTGGSKTMLANRISFWLDAKGPSYTIDLSCVSSMAALGLAYRAIKDGSCSSAIVTGSSMCLEPQLSVNLRRAGFLCLDGKTKCFDKNGDGFVRAEAVGALFLQKASDAKRIYAEVVHAKDIFFKKSDPTFLPVPKSDDIEVFLREFYSEVNVHPEDVEYVEAFGVGIKSGDENELEAISRIFTDNGTIKVGSHKSNMGHSDGASGLCALTKVCLAYHKGQLPANLHYKNPQDHIPAINDGRIQVVMENTPFDREYTAINSFSFTGVKHHTLMKGHYKKKNLEKYNTPLPRLVLASGRLETNVSKIFDSLKNNPVDAEQIALLHDFFSIGISGHTCRGYVILDTDENNATVTLAENVSHFPGTKSPVWFLYSGMGSQWAGMGAELMRIPTFAASIERCRKVLEPKGIGLQKIITCQDNSIFDNILHSFVGITAIQIGLTDLLREMGIVPDNIIGHSLGEQACAYADGCLTAEEIILLSYYRGLVSVETNFIEGLMAAVGLGHDKLSVLCPPEIEVACHNSASSSTISGPAHIMRKFIETLKSKNIFAVEVQTANIAYHSKYVAEAGPRILLETQNIIKNPKQRSDKWLCTSAPPEKWDLPETKYSSAEYFTNNLLHNVYFEEAARNIPDNAIVIEIAPHGLLQAIVKKSHKSCTHISLTKRGNFHPVKFLLEAVGKLFQAGLNPKIDVLYPKIEFPVSTETPLLSPLVGWAHNENWFNKSLSKQKINKIHPVRHFALTINDDDWSYFKGHVRNGATIFPEMAFLVLVWETLAMYKGLNYRNMSVIFEDICFEKELFIRKKEIVRFTIEIEMGRGRFEITDENLPIAYGFITEVDNPFINLACNLDSNIMCDDVVLTTKDVYMLLEVRGFSYTGQFQSILSSNTKLNLANIKWKNEWVTFLDSLIQLKTLSQDHDGVSNPIFIRKLTINTKSQKQILSEEVTAYCDEILDSTRCGGVQIDNIIFKQKPIMEKESNILEIRKFVSCFHKVPLDIDTVLRINLQIITENVTEKCLNITELTTEPITNKLNGKVKQTFEKYFPYFDIEINSVKIDDEETLENEINKKQNFTTLDIFILHNNILLNDKILNKVYGVLKKNTFLLGTVQYNHVFQQNDKNSFKIITSMSIGEYKMVLLRKTKYENNTLYIRVDDSKFSWVPTVKTKLESGKRVVLVSKKEECSGLTGIVKALKKDGFRNVGLFMINDNKAPEFSPQLAFYKEQIEKNLTFNILVKGLWGNHYYLPTNDSYEAKNEILTSKILKHIDTFKCEENSKMSGSEKVQVHYAGTSMPCSLPYGMDFSGYNTRGEKVMGLVASSALRSEVDSDMALLWPVPDHWTLEDAATVPQPYVYAYYCLMVRNKLQKYDTVLVLDGAGALGQAIISICLDLKCTVFTLVNNVSEQRLLLELFPNLKEEHITYPEYDMQSMVTYHADKVMLCTYVISCASGDLREQALKCVGLAGTFVDLNNNDRQGNKTLGLFYLDHRNYMTVILSSLFKNTKEKKILQHLLVDGLASGVVKPFTRVIYSFGDVLNLNNLAALEQCVERVLINMRDMVTLNKQMEFTSRIDFSSKGSYIVICDETILGVEVAGWLIKRGVRKVILHQKSTSTSAYYQVRKKSWRDFGVLSALSMENLLTYDGCANLLKECQKLGPVQGIFIITNSKGVLKTDINIQDSVNNELKENVTVVLNMDKASKKICSNLSYFVVVLPSSINQSGEFIVSAIDNICENRNDAKLPALVIHTDVLMEENTSSKVLLSEGLSKLFNTLNTSLKYKYINVVTRELNGEKDVSVEFMNTVSKIIGIPKFEAVEETKILSNFGINEACLNEIRNLLNRTFEIDYSFEELHRISIRSLKKLCDNAKPTRPAEGLKAFYNYIAVDEIFATEPIVILPNKITTCVDKLPDELHSEETHLIMIPGFEGHSRIFSSVVERLKIQAASLQLAPDLEGDSIPQMAKNVLKHVKETFKFDSKFYILGYSFGVNIALEMAAMLEKEGYTGVIYCLDSSPDAVKVQLNSYLGILPDSELQNSVITELYSLISGKDNKNLREELLNLDDWSKKVEHTMKKLQQNMTNSYEYIKAIIESAYKRIMLAKAYEPDIKLESKLVLVKGIPHPKAESLDYDYNLHKYTNRPVSVFQIETDHSHIPFDSDISNIVNKMLEKKLLEEYKNKNLCEVYPETVGKIEGS